MGRPVGTVANSRRWKYFGGGAGWHGKAPGREVGKKGILGLSLVGWALLSADPHALAYSPLPTHCAPSSLPAYVRCVHARAAMQGTQPRALTVLFFSTVATAPAA